MLAAVLMLCAPRMTLRFTGISRKGGLLASQIARRLRSAAARRREARFCGWLARGLWAGLHAAIIAVTLSANKGVAARIRRDMPYAASLAGVLAANVALFLYLCAADPGYVPVTERRLGGDKQAALGGAVSSCSRGRRRAPPIVGKTGALRGGAPDGDGAALLPVWRPPEADPRAHSHHMLAGASMLFESSFPDQVMLPAMHRAPPAPAEARKQRGSACSAQPSAAAAASRAEAIATLHRGHHATELKHAVSAPAEVCAPSSESGARESQLAILANGDSARSAYDHAAGVSVAPPTATRGGTGPAVAGGAAAPLSNGHLLGARGGDDDLEEQPLLSDPGAAVLRT